MADIQAALSALQVLSNPSDKAAFERANAWLQEFQHSPEAWSTCNVLLLSQDSPMSARIFAAQTFRAKVTYDLHQLDASHLPGLRDSLLSALEQCNTGPKTISIQLCLALAGLALQFPAWNNVFDTITEKFGRNPATVSILLRFLTILPEELMSNTRIPISRTEYRDRADSLLTVNSQKILDLLTLYITAQGVTPAVQNQIFACLQSWLDAGEISTSALCATPLFTYAFDALAVDELFESAVGVLCNLIHETQEVDDNMQVIQLIVPRLIALKPNVALAKDDTERMRGYARLFSEAGETYRTLILQHPEDFYPIVQAIGECSAYPDLDIVPITFQFWMRLAGSIGKKPTVSPLLTNAYKALMGVIIGHLHFPTDISSFTPQEADDFRSFRHVMGDTLKDCCRVLGSETCLTTVYELLTAAAANGPSVAWQDIEAPLFSLRSMGAELDPTDDRIIPKIMDLIPTLPEHPRIRYAAILFISRYSPWTNLHPDHITWQLQFISSGFESGDLEVAAAAGQAMSWLCRDCKKHMIPFLPQLHTFLQSVGSNLLQEDKRTIYEAAAYVMSAMTMDQAAQSLRLFSLEILAKVNAIAVQPTPVSSQDLKEASEGLENLEAMLSVVQGFGEELPEACKGSCEEAWSFFNPFIAKYGAQLEVSERASRVLRHAVKLFGASAKPVIIPVLSRLIATFETTGHSSHLWVAGKIVGQFGDEEEPAIRAAFRDVFDRSTSRLYALLQNKPAREMPDVIEDYVQLLLQYVDLAPDVFFQSPSFTTAFKIANAALTLVHADIVFAALDLMRIIFTHDCLDRSVSHPPPKFPIYANAVQQAIDNEGFQLLGNLLLGLMGDFPEDATSSAVTIFRMIAIIWPQKLLTWLPQVLEKLPAPPIYATAKSQLLADVTSAINKQELDKIKTAVITYHRFAMKARDRRRMQPAD